MSSILANSTPDPLSQQLRMELGKILLRYDPHATRIFDYISHVRVFRYDTQTLHWNNQPVMEGSLFLYQKKQSINNQLVSTCAFSVINTTHSLIQPIESTLSAQANQLRLFYQVTHHNQPEVYCLHFQNESECNRIHNIIQKVIQITIKSQESAASVEPKPTISAPTMTSNPQLEQRKSLSTHANGMTGPSQCPHLITSVGSSPSPVLSVNSNTSSEDLSLYLKRLLNIPHSNAPNEEKAIAFDAEPVQLLPPSAFQSHLDTGYSSMNNSNSTPVIFSPSDREHFRRTLLHLVENDDAFLDIIYQASFNRRWFSQ